MSFLQPMLLAALPLVALPIIIHLINQRRYQTIRWAAMMFLLAANRMSRGYARLRQWLIMAFRMAAIAGSDLRGQPAAGGGLAGPGRGQPRRHDDHPARPLAQHAAERAGRRRLEAGDRPAAARRGRSRRWARPLGPDRQRARTSRASWSRLEALLDSPSTEPTSASADLPAMLLAAHDYIRANKPGRTEIWICSDLRENDWNAESGRWQTLRDGFLEFPQGVRFHLLAYPRDRARQPGGARDRRPPPARPPTGRSCSSRCSIAREGGGDRRESIPVQFEIDGARSELTVEMAGPKFELKDHRIPLERSHVRGLGQGVDPGRRESGRQRLLVRLRRARAAAGDHRGRRSAGGPAAPARRGDLSRPGGQVLGRGRRARQAGGRRVGKGRAPALAGPAARGRTRPSLSRRSSTEAAGSIFFPPRNPGPGRVLGVRWTTWVDRSREVPVETWRATRTCWPRRRAARPLPVGQLQIRKYCGLAGEFTTLATLRGGAPLLARCQRRPRAASTSARPRPRRATRRWRPAASCSTCWCSAPWPRAPPFWATPRRLTAGDPAGDDPAELEARWPAPSEALSTEYPLHRGIYRAGDRLLAVNRAAAEDLAPVLADGRVAGLFRGLDFARVDDQAGNISSLIQEIWRLFLVAMMVAMVVEAGLCLPRPARRAGGASHERLPIADLPLDPWSLAISIVVVLVTAGFCFVAWRRSGYRRSMGLLELLRLALVVIAAILLNQPEWIEEYRPEEKPAVAVLWDASASMDTRDVVAPGKPLRLGADPPRGRSRRSPNRPPGPSCASG